MNWMKAKHSMLSLALMALLTVPGWAQAQSHDHLTEAERAALIRLVHLLDSTRPLLDQAEHNQAADTRFPVDYEQLRADLTAVREGLKRHLSRPARSPRKITPLSGDYSHSSNRR